MSNPNLLKNLAVSSTGFVFDPRTGATFSVNPTGLAVLLALRDGASVESAARDLVQSFDGATSATKDDVVDFVQSLRGYGLIGSEAAARANGVEQ
jgi:hypothetical protein